MGKDQKNCFLLKKLKKIKIETYPIDNKTDTIDLDQCDAEIELEEGVNNIEIKMKYSVIQLITKKTENDLDIIDIFSDKEILTENRKY